MNLQYERFTIGRINRLQVISLTQIMLKLISQ